MCSHVELYFAYPKRSCIVAFLRYSPYLVYKRRWEFDLPAAGSGSWLAD